MSCHLRSSFSIHGSTCEEWRSELQEELEQARNLLEIHWSEHHVPWRHWMHQSAWAPWTDIQRRFCCSICSQSSRMLKAREFLHSWLCSCTCVQAKNAKNVSDGLLTKKMEDLRRYLMSAIESKARIFESKFPATWGSSAGNRFLRTFFCQASVVSVCRSGRCWNWMGMECFKRLWFRSTGISWYILFNAKNVWLTKSLRSHLSIDHNFIQLIDASVSDTICTLRRHWTVATVVWKESWDLAERQSPSSSCVQVGPVGSWVHESTP